MIYFDSASTTLLKPPAVAQAVAQAVCSMGNPGRGVHGPALDAARIVFDTRRELAELFCAEGPDRIAFAANATQSLNIAIKGLIHPGDHVITTALEHNSVLRPLYELEAKRTELSIIPADTLGRIRCEDIESAIRANTRAIVCTHASNLTGNMLDLDRIGKIAQTHGLLFIADASQTAGIFPIDVRRMHIDALCFTGHKGLLGPQGTGGLYVREGLHIVPLLSGGSGIKTYSRAHPAAMPAALEAGTLNAHGIAGLNAALKYIRETGMDAIRIKEQALMRAFYEAVREIPGVTVYGDFSAPQRSAIVSLNVRDYDSSEVSDALYTQYGIATRPGAHCAPLMHQALQTVSQGAVRFSFSHFNTMDEIHTAISALRELAD